MQDFSGREARDQRASDQIEGLVRAMEQQALRRSQELHMSETLRHTADRAARGLAFRRRYAVLAKHTRTQLRVLRCLILVALAENSVLQRRAAAVAAYYSRNYAYEWLTHDVTAPVRLLSRDMILRTGDSEWGETPLAGAVAYVIVHHRELKVQHPSDYGELYTRALALTDQGFFHDLAEPQRRRLGLASHQERQREALEQPREG